MQHNTQHILRELRRNLPLMPQIAVSAAGATSVQPLKSYTQQEVRDLFGLTHPVVQRFIEAPHIQKRHLLLPDPDPSSGLIREENAAELQEKFKVHAQKLGIAAITKILAQHHLSMHDIDMLYCVTSTGFLVPSLSARLIAALHAPSHIQKMDIVGMGCNAAVSALNPLVGWLRAHPGKRAIMLCCELNSAAYNLDQTIRTGIVNSLFGDNVSALLLQSHEPDAIAMTTTGISPHFIDFESYILSDQLDAMRFDYDSSKEKSSFFLSPEIPFVVGANAHIPVLRLLERHGLRVDDINHWIIHTGGAAVIDGVKKSLSLSEYDVRHTRSVLRDYGNVSSGSVLLSLERLLAETICTSGDLGIMLAMGPGASFDAALLRWT